MAAKKTVKPVAVATSATAPKAEKVEATDTKKVETPAAEVKTEEKAEKPVAAKKEVKPAAVKKAPAKKTSAKKETKPAAAKKPAAKKAELKSEIILQFAGKELTQEQCVEKAKEIWKNELKQKVSDLVDIKFYVKPEENRVYCVMNTEFEGRFDI